MRVINALLWITLGIGVLTLVVLGALPFTWRSTAINVVGISFLANIGVTTIGILKSLSDEQDRPTV